MTSGICINSCEGTGVCLLLLIDVVPRRVFVSGFSNSINSVLKVGLTFPSCSVLGFVNIFSSSLDFVLNFSCCVTSCFLIENITGVIVSVLTVGSIYNAALLVKSPVTFGCVEVVVPTPETKPALNPALVNKTFLVILAA